MPPSRAARTASGSPVANQPSLGANPPWPGAWFDHGQEQIKVLAAAPTPRVGAAAPGTVQDDALTVACGEGALRLLRVQRPGRAPMDAAALLRGFALPAGARLAVEG